jgi:hypothetical protein
LNVLALTKGVRQESDYYYTWALAKQKAKPGLTCGVEVANLFPPALMHNPTIGLGFLEADLDSFRQNQDRACRSARSDAVVPATVIFGFSQPTLLDVCPYSVASFDFSK